MPSNSETPLVVVDTSVWVGAFFKGDPKRMLDAWRAGRYRLACARPIEAEYKTILLKIPPIRVQARAWLQELKHCDSVVWLESLPDLDVEIDDPDDRKFLQCASGAGAKTVVSLDGHLLNAGPVPGVRVMKPGAFLSELDGAPEETEPPAGFWHKIQRWFYGNPHD